MADAVAVYEARARVLHAALMLAQTMYAQPTVTADDGGLAWDQLEWEYGRVAEQGLEDACRGFVEALDE